MSNTWENTSCSWASSAFPSWLSLLWFYTSITIQTSASISLDTNTTMQHKDTGFHSQSVYVGLNGPSTFHIIVKSSVFLHYLFHFLHSWYGNGTFKNLHTENRLRQLWTHLGLLYLFCSTIKCDNDVIDKITFYLDAFWNATPVSSMYVL